MLQYMAIKSGYLHKIQKGQVSRYEKESIRCQGECSAGRKMETHHMNKSPFVRHMKDVVPPPHRRYLGVWESTNAERGQALGMQPVSACPLGPRGSAPAFLLLPRAFWTEM